MAKDLEKKIKEAKSEEELLKVLESADGEELTDEELELVTGGGYVEEAYCPRNAFIAFNGCPNAQGLC